MTPPTTLLDRVRLRLRSRRALERALAVAEADRDGARAVALGWQREARAAQAHASHWRRNVGELVGWQSEGRTDGELHRRLVRIVEDGGRAQDLADAARDELDAVRDELRATGHPIGTRGLSYDVDAAIDRERSRAQDVVERLADALSQTEHAIWPHSVPRLLREVARLTGRSISTRRVRPSDWPAGSFMARQLACTCRGSVAGSGSSVVDSQCAEHSPGYRFGGRPVQPLALPSATARSWTGEPVQPVDDDVVDTQIVDALDRWEGDATSGGWVCDACGRPVDELPCPEHQPLALADARAEADGVPF